MAEYRKNNRDKINSLAREWKASNKDKQRDAKLKERYGISLLEYNKMYSEQSGLCAICGSSEVKRKNSTNFLVDHCHETGRVRGLLCYKCNVGLGAFEDNKQFLLSAISYLEVKDV